MKRACVALLFLLSPLVSGQQSTQEGLPLVITDKQAVDEWRQAVWDGPLDPGTQEEAAFLLSLTETEWLGRFRFEQRCALCHTGRQSVGPPLTQRNVVGREEAVRRHILEGSARMPAFKYALEPKTVDAILAYLKKVQKAS
jgi:hypothetical protein